VALGAVVGTTQVLGLRGLLGAAHVMKEWHVSKVHRLLTFLTA